MVNCVDQVGHGAGECAQGRSSTVQTSVYVKELFEDVARKLDAVLGDEFRDIIGRLQVKELAFERQKKGVRELDAYCKVDNIDRLLALVVNGKVENLLLEADVALVHDELACKLVRLDSNVERNVGLGSELCDLQGTHARDDASVRGHSFSTHNDHVDLAQKTHDIGDRRLRDFGNGDSLGSKFANDAVALLNAGLLADVDDLEFCCANVLHRALENTNDRP